MSITEGLAAVGIKVSAIITTPDRVSTLPFPDGRRISWGASGDGWDWTHYTASDEVISQDWEPDDAAMTTVIRHRAASYLKYGKQEIAVMRRAENNSWGSSTYQPTQDDLDAAQRLMDLGVVEKEPGFDTLVLTGTGRSIFERAA